MTASPSQILFPPSPTPPFIERPAAHVPGASHGAQQQTGSSDSPLQFSLDRPHARQRTHRRAQTRTPPLLCSITSRVSHAQDSFINEHWDRIAHGNSTVTAEDLEAYARGHGLPTAYIKDFMTYFGNGKNASNTNITREKFQEYVRSHEQALLKAFRLFDKDGDGRIGVEDLEGTLSHVVVCCCRTRCVYRAPRGLARKLLAQTQAAGGTDGSTIDFNAFRRFFMLLPRTEMALEYWLRAGSAIDCSEKRPAIYDSVNTHRASAWGHLLAGALAGAASRTATAPLETLRLAVMTGSTQAASLKDAAAGIVQSHGISGLYRGNGLNVMRSAPQKALDFFAFDGYKRLLARLPSAGGSRGQPDNPAHTFVAAGLAGASSWVLLYPLETLRCRVSTGAATAHGMQGLRDLLRSIVAREGIGGLYRGCGWSMAGIFPEAAMCYGLHDFLKDAYTRAKGGVEPGVLTSLSFGVVSAFAGQLLAFPLETVARRLQVQQGAGGLKAVVRQILAEGGPSAFYRGVGAATLRLVPMAGVSFGTYEAVRCGLLALEEAAGTKEAEQEYQQLHAQCAERMAQQASRAREQDGCSYSPLESVPLLNEDQMPPGHLDDYCLPTCEQVQSTLSCSGSETKSNSSSAAAGFCLPASTVGLCCSRQGTKK